MILINVFDKRLKSTIRMRQWRRDNPERYAATVRMWRASNPDRHKQIVRNATLSHYRRKSGWTPESVVAAKEAQDNRCAICRKSFTKEPHADHKHTEPPIPRGLLCSQCNTGLGLLQDSPETCEAAAAYLRRYI